MQWGEADNENTAKQKTDQAKCEEMWPSSFKNQRQSWCKLGKSSSLYSGSSKTSVQNQNKTKEHMTISIRRKIPEKLIWKNQKTVILMFQGTGNSQAVGRNLGWQRRDRPQNLTTLDWVKANLFVLICTCIFLRSYIPILQKVILYGDRR